MRLLLDQNVPNSVATVFADRGYTVLHLRDLVAPDSPDPIVATVSELENAVLVSSDGDFDKIAPRVPDGQRRRFRKLSRITLKCKPSRAAQRIAAAMSLIEAEYEIAQNSRDPRMIVVVGDSFIRTNR